MRIFRSARWLLLALVLPFIPIPQANAGVYISVGFAPPILPVYVQPPCPEPDLIWSPGYWAYGDEGYYWVPGAWVPAPYEGALWTPPYWGWRDDGLYVFHPGYWGPEVGYYGGVNYGFGYMGIGFIGGRWHEHRFEYNTAVVRVNETYIHTTYIDRTVIREHEVDHESRVSYAGGRGGIHHDPNQDERHAMQVQHLPPTQYQQQHFEAARNDHSNYFNANHGRPQNVALAHPLQAEHHDPPAPVGVGARGGPTGVHGDAGARGDYRNGQQAQPVPQQRPTAPIRQQDRQQDNPRSTYQQQPRQDSRPAPEPRPNNQPQQRPDSRPAPEPRPNYQPQPRQDSRPAPEPRPNYQPQQRPESRPAPEPRPNYQPQPRPESRPGPEPRNQAPPQPRPESRPAPEPRYQAPPQPRPESRPAPEPRYQPQPRPEPRPAPQSRPAPPPRQEARPAPEPRHDSKEPREKEPRR